MSDQFVEELLKEISSDLDFGEKTFVEDFLQHEMTC